MRKAIFILFLCMFCIMNDKDVEAYKKGNFRYDYEYTQGGIWITNITPLSDKGIATLKIPAKIEGKKVVKLGAPKDTMDTSWEDDDSNLFGMKWSEDYADLIVPKKVHDRVAKIKTIQIPSTVKKITMNCFNLIPDGKTINIPKGVTRNVEWLIDTKWKKMTISPKNKTYKIVRGCLLTKDGTKMYGFVQKRKKVVIPNTVKEMLTFAGDYNGVSEIVIPKSVKKIEEEELEIANPVTVKISKKNKIYAEENGCIYNKKRKCMVAGCAPDGVLKIPKNITSFYGSVVAGEGFLGPKADKMIIPAGIKKMEGFLNLSSSTRLTCILKGKNPPKFSHPGYGVSELILYIPKGSKSVYEKTWKFSDSLIVTYIEQEL